MAFETWLAFAAASAILLVIPGPTILTVISYSLAHGRRANAPLVAAVTLGDSTALVLSLLGLGALLATSAFLFTLIKWAGGLYLIFLGLRMLRSGASIAALAQPAAPARRLLSSPTAQRRFNLAGGGLLTGAGIWALLAKRNGVGG